jgi:adenylyltransferase/sulfurtransferase
VYLNDDELLRYSRQNLLKEIGIEGQNKLKAARVVCVGAGGLGSPLLIYLATAGVGTLGIIDGDIVEKTNLHRQILYDNNDIGLKKIACAEKNLRKLNPNINLVAMDTYLSPDNGISLLRDFDIVVDCTDNFSARYAINDASFYLNKPNVFAGIAQFKGQCSIFASTGPCYRCIYPMPSLYSPSCTEAGVLGVLPGTLGMIQATEVIKLILQIGQPLIGTLLTFDALSMEFSKFDIQKDLNCVLCGINSTHNQLIEKQNMTEISVDELKNLLFNDQCFLLDVREPEEYLQANMGGKLIPLKELPNRLNELPKDKLIVVHCKSGKRSAAAVAFLEAEGFNSCKSLSGGILAYMEARG